MKQEGHVTCMGEMRKVYNISVGKPRGRNHWEDTGVDGRIILKSGLEKEIRRARHVQHTGNMRNVCKILNWKNEREETTCKT